MMPAITSSVATAAVAPEGQGFHLNASDLRHIFKQIQIAEQHVANPGTPDNPCASLVGDGPNQIPRAGNGRELPWGLRTVDGSCNNVFPIEGRDTWGAADTEFPRLVPAKHRGGYNNPNGNVVDPEPRRISNLIVDQTNRNPAAVEAAGTDVAAADDNGTLAIGNVAPDAGLSAPFNSWFTLFGQFFDHGLDLVTKSKTDSVVMPLAADDPLVVGGRDGDPATTADNVPAGTPMILSRTVNSNGREATNTTTSYVDQNQTYTSHPAHQVFLREYADAAAPTETGGLLTGPGGGMATWDDVQAQASSMLGIELDDMDVLNVPLLVTDPYGHFTRGTNVRPRVVFAAGDQPAGASCTAPSGGNVTCVGTPANPLDVTNAVKTGHAFLDDIAHAAVPNAAGTHNSVLLGQHFVAGDGRANENIGLTAVHHIFHAEHNRLQADIDGMIRGANAVLTTEEATAWQNLNPNSGWGYGERLFQAARFVTEMEYQHLVFEEFARKVQPMVNVFGEEGGYHPEVNAAIRAEFAHAVYRFGHSMLTETVARKRFDGTNDSLPLMSAFLNPNEFLDGYTKDVDGTTVPDPEAAAGAIIRGMTRQTGNEIDEFVTEALRNNLLGLPLDLATINMARARDAGVPRLNEARRAFFAKSGNTALQPYESWADFGFSLKHRASLVNFIAAYGTHGTVTAETTVAGRRNAAALLLYGPAGADGVLEDIATTPENEAADNPTGTQPADASDFLNGTGTWADDPETGLPTTGLEDIDLWVGGLAEKQMVFGGLLGPTFNYVFELQMEDLQDGDRFYYLHRTPGMNLLTQLEGNSFSELIMRNTDVQGLPADSFSRPDLVFNLANLSTVEDNPDTVDIDESTLLTTMADGTLRFSGTEHAVFNGSAENDRIWSSEGDDTIRGNDGDDWIQGGDGNDNHVGGLGNDILVDLNGDDVIKGGGGHDAISSGQGGGGDLNQGGFGNDFILGGNDITETFAGEGDDVVYGGDAEDFVFGDGGDDWIEGGRGPFDQLMGDNGQPFQDDINEAGHDVMIAYGGEKDYDSEGGDDIMLHGPGIQRSEGMRGFDWVTHQGDPLPADSDMLFTGLLPPIEANRDRFDMVEALSGANFNDILRGDDRGVADLTPPANEPKESHVLDAAGVARITGANTLFRADQLPSGDRVFAGGNIIMGGDGSDVLEGRGGDDIIDGDAQLEVRLVVPYKDGSVRKVTSMLDVQADVLAGRTLLGQHSIERMIVRPSSPGDHDVALFSNPQDEYTITNNADGTVTVAHDGGTGIDGTDTLRGIEEMLFNQAVLDDTPDPPAAPTLLQVTPGVGSVTVNFTAGADGGLPITEFRVSVFEGSSTTPDRTLVVPSSQTSLTVKGLTPGVPVRVTVAAVNAAGVGTASAKSAPVTPKAPEVPDGDTGTPPGTGTTPPGTGTPPGTVPPPPGTGSGTTPPGTTPPGTGKLTAPDAPKVRKAKSGKRGGVKTATARWAAPAVDGGSAVTGYRVYAIKIGANGKVKKVTRSKLIDSDRRSIKMRLPAGLYRFQVMAINDIGQGDLSARSNTVVSR